MTNSKALVLLASALVALALVCGSSSYAWSIQSADPVKVTHRNSGPKYDIDDVEKTKLNPTDDNNRLRATEEPKANIDSNSNNNNNNNDNNEQPADGPIPIGHMSIRRIFLVPMSHESSGDQEQLPNAPFMPRPFWPFSLAPAVRQPGSPQPQHHHLFGSDQASRSPTSSSNDNDSGEREGERESAPSGQVQPPTRPIFDPIQMMVDLMHQAINGQLAPPTDLINEATSSSDNSNNNNNNNKQTNEIDRPIKPQSQNETKEDIVEIDGKKYLRKTVINRHVGENIIFMTKRLIFVPLNETDSSATTTTETTTTTTTTVKPSEVGKDDDSSSSSSSAEIPIRPTQTTTAASGLASSPTTTSETTRTNPVATSSPTEPQTTTTTTGGSSTTLAGNQPEETTTSTSASTTAPTFWVERLGDTIDKAAERIVEGVPSVFGGSTTTTTTTTTTEKPASL